MANLLEQALTKQHVANQQITPAFTFDTKGKVQPKEAKGKLLPSRIFGSPIEYAKDLKQDILNINKAAKGKANDHELGRINDLAIKIGSLAIAVYLAIKNPLKLNKTMQFVGFGSFFASMALLPKILIQAPLKARTGVDIHQKYIDSQGRKKMLMQDPQYVLTDLYSQEDLDKMGKKLKVNEKLPDRNNFIKQRATKVGIQGNTLWMMAAGAAPVYGALISSLAEKPINKALEKSDIYLSKRALNTRINLRPEIEGAKEIDKRNLLEKINESLFNKSHEKFLKNHADDILDDKMAKKISNLYAKRFNAPALQSAVEQELLSIGRPEMLTLDFVKDSLKSKVPAQIFENMNDEQLVQLNQAIQDKSFKKISDLLSKMSGGNTRQQRKLNQEIFNTLKNAKSKADLPKVSDVVNSLNNMHGAMSDFCHNKSLLDKYISSVVGDKSGTYIANTWDKFTTTALKSLKLSTKEMKKLSQGDFSVLENKLTELSKDNVNFDKVVSKLMNIVNNYEEQTGKNFVESIESKSEAICRDARKRFKNQGLHNIADSIIEASDSLNTGKAGTLKNTINKEVKNRISGAQSSFYRFMQTLDVYKRASDNTLKEQLVSILKEQTKAVGSEYTDDAIETGAEKLVGVCKKVILNATTSDYVEKLTSSGYELSEVEYKTVMKALFGSKAGKGIQTSVKDTKVLEGLKKYKSEFMAKIANWQNDITPELKHRVVDATTNSLDAVERNNLTGKPIKGMIQDIAKKAYNSKKWLMLWAGIGLAVAAITLTVGLFIGKKSKTEKEAEAQLK